MRRLTIPALISFEAAMIMTLHRLAGMPGFEPTWRDLQAPATRLDDAVASGLRYVALTLAYWLAASTAAYVAARLSRVPAAIRTAGRYTLPAVRRLVDRTVAVGLTVGILTTPLVAVAQEPGESPPSVEQTYLPPPTGFLVPPTVDSDNTVVVPPGVGAAPLETPDSSATDPPGDEYVVVSGDNLWSIAAATVGASLPASSEAEIVTYWLELIAANHRTLVSGDPDLIYPGERLILPPVGP